MADVVLLLQYGGEWVLAPNKKPRYVGGVRKMEVASANTTYKELKDLICKRLGIDRKQYRITMQVKYPRLHNEEPYEISDDKDVYAMMSLSLKGSSSTPLEIFVSVTEKERRASPSCGNLVSSDVGTSGERDPNAQQCWSPWHVTPWEEQRQRVWTPEEGCDGTTVDVGDGRGHTYYAEVDLNVDPEDIDEVDPDDLLDTAEDGVDHNGVDSAWGSFVGGEEYEDVHGPDVEGVSMGVAADDDHFMNREFTGTSYHEAEADGLQPPVHVYSTGGVGEGLGQQHGVTDHPIPDPFHWIPQATEIPGPSITPGDVGTPTTFKVMDIFPGKDVLVDAFRRHAIENGYQYKVLYSTKVRWEITCIHDSCRWRARAIKIKDCDYFQLRRMDDRHTCPRDQIRPHHRQAGARALGQLLKTVFVMVDRVYRPKEIISDMADRYRIDISYSQAWRAKNWAMNALRGSAEESFLLLPEYCHNLKLRNPGTVTYIQTDADDRFDFFFMSLGCSIRSFQRQLIRPVICLDGAFLRGKYCGTLFIAVGKDGNNQIYPLAFGIGPKEEARTWSLFLFKIRECIGELPDLAIISDRHAGIIAAVREIFPHAHHGCCCQHLKANIKANYGSVSSIVHLYWKAAKAYRRPEFDHTFRMLQRAKPAAAEHLRHVGIEKWARSYFPGLRYNIMTTNIAESFNALVKNARGLPITMLVEFIRSTLQRWFHERRSAAGML